MPVVERTELTVPSGNARLSGTLYMPRSSTPRPVVVVFHGAADPLRAAPLYRHLIAMLPPLGIGVFVYDRRGSGRSTGPSAAGSYAMLADDGIAARRYLATRPGVDPRRIGFWGLSQGGWLAALGAQRDPACAFAISVSAPMVPADVQMRFAVANILRIRGYDDAAIGMADAARAAVDGFMRGEVDRPTAQRAVDLAAAQPWFGLTYMGRTFDDPEKSDWAHEMQNDPLSVMRQIRTPMLVLYGSADPWVPVATSLDRLKGLLVVNPRLEVGVVTGADHMMMTSVPPLTQVDPQAILQQSPEAPEYFGVMTSWLVRNGFAGR